MIKLLDCTLRDGGYYTSWDFDKNLVREYLNYIEKLPIEYIEIGYRSSLKEEYFGEYFYLPMNTIKFIKDNTSKKLSIMLNVKDCLNVDLKELLGDVKKDIEIIKLAIDPNKIENGLNIAKILKEVGFKVGFNLMYISKIDDNHKIYNYLTKIEEYGDILYLVDSYGAIFPNNLEKLIQNIQKNISLPLGFHGHNNLELAFSNALTAINNDVEYIDSTILGMGRGAGNLKTELFLTYLKNNYNFDIDLNILSKLVELFKPLQDKYKWGTNFAYIVSGSYSLPQKDVMEALEINRYSITSIINKLTNNFDRLPIYQGEKKFKKALIIGGGESVKNCIEAIKLFLKQNNDIAVIHSTSKYIHLFEDIKNHQIFAISGDEITKLEKLPNNIDFFVTNPNPIKLNIKDERFYQLESIDFTDIKDSPLSVSLEITNILNIKDIYLVGYDGYNETKNKKELYLMQETQSIIDNFNKKLISLTKTNYKNIVQSSVFGMIK